MLPTVAVERGMSCLAKVFLFSARQDFLSRLLCAAVNVRQAFPYTNISVFSIYKRIDRGYKVNGISVGM